MDEAKKEEAKMLPLVALIQGKTSGLNNSPPRKRLLLLLSFLARIRDNFQPGSACSI